jgi:hypothetical protein
MALKKSVELGQFKFEFDKDAFYINGDMFQHEDANDLVFWLQREMPMPFASDSKMHQVAQQRTASIAPTTVYLPKEADANPVMRDEELHPEKYAKLPSPDQLGNRTQGVEALKKLKIGDAFKAHSASMGNSTGQQIVGVENVDLVKLAAQAGQIVNVTRES